MLKNTPAAWDEAAPPSGDFPFRPAAEARMVAEEIALERATPEMMTRVLGALDAANAEAAAIDVVDLAVANAMLYYAGPGYEAGLPIADHARAVLDEATALRIAGTMELNGMDPTEGAAFDADGLVLASTGKVLREDVQRVTYQRVLDFTWMSETLTVSEYDYFFHKYYRYFSYSYHQYQRYYTLNVDYDYRLEVLQSYYQEMQEWTYTRGVTTQVVNNVADAGEGMQGHALSTVVTPFMHVDHWWMIVYTESLFREHRTIDYDYAYSCDNIDAPCGNPTPDVPDSTRTVWVESYEGEDTGSERILFPLHELIGNLNIQYYLPANEYQPLARATPIFDAATAPVGAITDQAGVEYKDEKASNVLLASPVLSDIGFAFDEEPFASDALTRADEVVATFDTHWNQFRADASDAQAAAEAAAGATVAETETAIADAQAAADEATAPVVADPMGFVIDNAQPPEELPVDVFGLLDTVNGVVADPQGFVDDLGIVVPEPTPPTEEELAALVADALADAEATVADAEANAAATLADAEATAAATLADAEAEAGALETFVMGVLEDPEAFAAGKEAEAREVTVNAPSETMDTRTSMDDHAWIVATFSQRVGRTYDDVHAVLGIGVAQDAYLVDGDNVFVKISADGLGDALLFELDLNGGTLVADETTVGGDSVNVGDSLDAAVDAGEDLPDAPDEDDLPDAPSSRVMPADNRLVRWEV